MNSHDLVFSGSREDLFSSSDVNQLVLDEPLFKEEEIITNEEEKIEEEKIEEPIINDFNPPPVIQDEDSFLAQTPVIKFTTPIRRKREPTFEEDNAFPSIPPPNFKSMTPLPDYSDDEVVNQRVKELINSGGEINYDNEDEKVRDAVMEAFTIKYQN